MKEFIQHILGFCDMYILEQEHISKMYHNKSPLDHQSSLADGRRYGADAVKDEIIKYCKEHNLI